MTPFWEGCWSGRTAVSEVTRFPTEGYPVGIAAQVPPPPATVRNSIPRRAGLSLADRFALYSAAEALERAGIPAGSLAARRAGVFLGSSTGGMYECEEFYRKLGGRPVQTRAVAALGSQQVSGPADAVARRCGITGPVETVSSACSSATVAIQLGAEAIRSGELDLALVGGADSLCRVTLGGFGSLQSLDPAPSRPFRTDRKGLSLGEGGAILVLESPEAADARGARPLARISGGANSADAYHMTAPDPTGEGVARTIRAALGDADVPADTIDLINAHGTGTALNDAAEFAGLEAVFGERARDVPLSCTKGSVGHLLGSAGGIEALATTLCLETQTIPPNPGGGDVDPETPVGLVGASGLRDCRLRAAVSLNLAFGGSNAALVLERCTGR